MRNVFITFMNISLSVSILFLLLNLVDFIAKTRYSRRWKHLAFLLLGIRLILPINLGLYTLPIVPVEDGLISQPQINLTTTSNLEEDSTDSMNLTSMVGNTKDSNYSYNLDSPNNSLLDSNKDQSLQNNNQLNEVSLQKSGVLNTIKNSPLTFCISIWLLGIIIFSLYHLLSYITFNNKLKRYAKPTNNATYLDILKELKANLHITRNIQLLTYAEISSPLLIGYGNPCIILPNSNYTKEQITFIIKHELTHYKHHDLYIKLLLIVSNALHWFNPIIYILVKQASLTMELYCDECVTAKQTLTYKQQYSLTLLQIMKDGNIPSAALLSTGFSNHAKHMKERFRHIMNGTTKRKGSLLIILTICLIIIGTNLVAGQSKKSANADTHTDIQTDETNNNKSDAPEESIKESENITNILILGIDTTNINKSDYPARPDSILLITLNKEKKEVTFNTILRNILVDIPGYEKNKIANAYVLGGEDLMKATLEQNFDIIINHYITMDMGNLESCIDLLGGATVTLSMEEAEYLNNTNYISNKKNRNVIEGSQRLNGNQTLGYLRIRHVPLASGETNENGRNRRLIHVIDSIYNDVLDSNIEQLIQIAGELLPAISTDLNLDDIMQYTRTYFSPDTKITYQFIPLFENCESTSENGMSVLKTDLEQAKKMFSEYMQ